MKSHRYPPKAKLLLTCVAVWCFCVVTVNAQWRKQAYHTSNTKPSEPETALTLKLRMVYKISEIRSRQQQFLAAQYLRNQYLNEGSTDAQDLELAASKREPAPAETSVKPQVPALPAPAELKPPVRPETPSLVSRKITEKLNSLRERRKGTATHAAIGQNHETGNQSQSFTKQLADKVLQIRSRQAAQVKPLHATAGATAESAFSTVGSGLPLQSLKPSHAVSRALMELKVEEIRYRSASFRASAASDLASEKAEMRRPMTEEERDRQYQEVVRLLYYFGKFVEWPRKAYYGPDDPHLIGSLHLGKWATYFGEMEGLTVRERQALFRHCPDGLGADRVHVLFVNTTDPAEIQGVLEITRNLPVLTVGSGEEFLKQGGIIRLYLDDNQQMRVHINVDAMYRNDLSISSGLLNLADIYREGDSQG